MNHPGKRVTELLPTDKQCTGLIIVASECVTQFDAKMRPQVGYILSASVLLWSATPQVPLFGTIEPSDQSDSKTVPMILAVSYTNIFLFQEK